MTQTQKSLSGAILVAIAALNSAASEEDLRVVGLTCVGDSTYVAVWCPLETSESISGIRWYNNDQYSVFPEVLALAGDPAQPGEIADAEVIGADVQGTNTGWSELTFSNPIASTMPGVYVAFRLPPGSILRNRGANGGAGFGYREREGSITGWSTPNGTDWYAFSGNYEIATEALQSQDKSGSAIVLPRAREESQHPHSIPQSAELALSAFPNPFNPYINIQFEVPQDGGVELCVYDARGRRIVSLLNQHLSAGSHIVGWNGTDSSGGAVASGVYIVKVQMASLSTRVRIVLAR